MAKNKMLVSQLYRHPHCFSIVWVNANKNAVATRTHCEPISYYAADISQRHGFFSREMTSEKQAQKFHTDYASLGNAPLVTSLPSSCYMTPLFSASFQTFCLTALAYLNTKKYGLFCSPGIVWLLMTPLWREGENARD